jgi:hypothetical protein
MTDLYARNNCRQYLFLPQELFLNFSLAVILMFERVGMSRHPRPPQLAACGESSFEGSATLAIAPKWLQLPTTVERKIQDVFSQRNRRVEVEVRNSRIYSHN